MPRCLVLRTQLPPDTFLTVNVSPHLLTDPALGGPLLGAGDLAPLVLELTEHRAVTDLRPLSGPARPSWPSAARLLALDDAGVGYSGLHQMTAFRPHLIKLDRALVDGADRDEVKLALAELLGEFGGRIDAWLLAEGIETWGELEAFQRLGVPLARASCSAGPAAPWSGIDPADRRPAAGRRRPAELVDTGASLVERCRWRPRSRPAGGSRCGATRPGGRWPCCCPCPVRADRAGHRHPAAWRPRLDRVVELARRIAGPARALPVRPGGLRRRARPRHRHRPGRDVVSRLPVFGRSSRSGPGRPSA